MKKILFVLIFQNLTVLLFSQNTDKFNLEIAKEIGICFDSLVPIDGDEEYYYPLCSDSNVRVFYLKPNYYVVYNQAPGWCGSAGCSVELYKKENHQYISIPASIYIGHIDINQEINDYIIYSDVYKKSLCWTYYKVKMKVKDDLFYFDKIIEYDHKIHHEDHDKDCRFNDSLILLR